LPCGRAKNRACSARLAYIQKHIATRSAPEQPEHAKLPEFMWETYPITPLRRL
jgi:hypothetical protein